ncbi:phospholipase D-like domain-containing protein [Stackebrandtia nassauensis]|uniref:phospholipase D n=1 Tax=Stackebrandtia nassauensis (strain DSM 44728 / CIP 108903 / NRRL B-16338 / NBRC 102104 / LLR-40K-21) TaxID=446470 RepID=D3PY11_STANL|nr:phospholipase D-like domain-containing protein [Stackebrandtia nassauensis]ADD45340.1 Phosphatidylserine/phosphatidylglycerophosphate/ cardiolipin synthase-like protein [Stackebrandtia nassauensis DSM 44728]
MRLRRLNHSSRTKRTLIYASALAVVAAGTVGATTYAQADASTRAGGCTASGAYEVCFNDPAGGSDPLIETRLRELTRSAESGDSIRVSLYTWTRAELANDLVAAKKRGVDVKVVLDGHNKTDGNAGYTVLRDGGVPVTSCSDNGCIGSNVNHNKLYLFNIDGVKQSVLSSANLSTAQTGWYNNLIRITDSGLYDYYQGYWNRMNAQSWTYDGVTWHDDDKVGYGSSTATKAYVYPRGTDNVLGVLGNVTKCSTDGNGDGNSDRKIWVAQSLFTQARESVRNKLADLQDMGCDVRIVVADGTTEKWVQSSNSGGNLSDAKVGTVTNTHNKLILIDAYYAGKWQDVVFTGSHNLTGTSLDTNDEALVRVTDYFVFKEYRVYFDKLFGLASGTS